MSGVHVFRFWGALDALAILAYVVTSLLTQRVPLYSDLVTIMSQIQCRDVFGMAFSMLSLGLLCSIALSAFLFLTLHRHARMVAYWQTPFRLLLMKPSLVIVLWLFLGAGDRPMVLLGALLLSEMIKVATLYLTRGFPADA